VSRVATPPWLVLVLSIAFVRETAPQTSPQPAPQPAPRQLDPRLAAELARYDRGDTKGAKEALALLQVTAKDDGALQVLAAHELELRQEHLAAEPFARRAVALLPEFAPAQQRLGICLLSTQRAEEAEAIFRAAAKRFSGTPDEPDLVFHLGMACAMQNKRIEAGESFARALVLRPKDNLYRFSAAENDRNLKHFEAAEAGFRLAMAEPRHPDAGWKLATTVAAEGRFDEAEKLFRSELKNLPPSSRVTAGFEFAAFLFDRGRPAEALPMLESLVKARPNHRLAWYYLARTYRLLGRAEDAASAVKHYQALQAEADRSDEEYLLGLIRARLTESAGEPERKEMPSRH
jgi:predicted Zn-dependent protease